MKKRILVVALVLVCIFVCLTLLSCGKENICQVSFNTHGGTRISSVGVEKGEKVGKPRTPYKAGYEFDGWVIEDEKWSFVGYIVTEDMTLEASWVPITYTIEYVGASTNGPTAYTVEDTLPLDSGYGDYLEFCGWYLDKEYTKPISQIEMGTTGNLTLYAKTEAKDLVFGAINDSEYMVLDVNPQATHVTIPDEIDNKRVTKIGKEAFAKCTQLKRVSIGKYVSEIEENAFLNCTTLFRVTGGENISIIGDYAFSGCSALGNICLGYNVTKIGKEAFGGCSNLSSIYLPLSTAQVGDGAFLGCGNVQIYCEAVTMPQGWSQSFQDSRILVRWGYNERLGLDFELIDGRCVVEGTVVMVNERTYDLIDGSYAIAIPSTYDGFDVVGIEENAFKNCFELGSIYIPSTIEYISPSAFDMCKRLKKIQVSSTNKNYQSLYGSLYTKNGDTLVRYAIGRMDTAFAVPYSVRTIGKGAFSGAEYLEIVEITNASIGKNAFYNCNNLRWVGIWGNSHAITIGQSAYESCDKLTTVEFGGSGDDTNEELVLEITGEINLEAIGENAFKDCLVLKRINIPNSVISIGDGCFSNCTSLEEITFGKSLEEIGSQVFYGCKSLKSISTNQENEHFTSIDGNLYTKDQRTFVQYALGKNEELFEIPEGVVEIGKYAFDSCTNLTKLCVPDSIEIIDKKSFTNCNVLFNRGVSGLYLGNEENPYLVLVEADNISNPQISAFTKVIASYAFEYCDELGMIKIPEGVLRINDCAFINCQSLGYVTLPDTLEYIGKRAFEFCRSISSIKIPDNVKVIGDYAFNGCRGIKTVVLGKSVEYIGDFAFSSSPFLERITIPASVNAIGKGVFESCSQLESITVEEGNQYYATIDGNLYTIDLSILIRYAGGKADVSFTIPDGVEVIDDYAFQSNYHLESIIVPNGVTTIGNYAFAGSYVLKEIVLPQGILEIGKGAFKSCGKLESITIPEGALSIGDEAFAFCSSLKELAIPESVEYLGKNVFLGCPVGKQES